MKDSTPIQPKKGTGASNQEPRHTQSVTLLDCIALLLKHKKLIGGITGTALIISVVVSLLLPVRYMATARILPPNDRGGEMSNLLNHAEGMFTGLTGSLMGNKTPSELYVGIMKSRSVADALIHTFELKEKYDVRYIEDVYQKLANQTQIEVDKKNKIITVKVEDKSPQSAADMANAYIDHLDSINRRLNITEGQKKREYLEERLQKVKADLTQAEISLKSFQERHKLISINDQAKIAIEAAAKIKSKIIAAQTQMEVQRQFGTARQNEAVMLKSKIEALERQLTKIETGKPESVKEWTKGHSDFFIPMATLPELGLKLAHMTREAKIQAKVYELVRTQYEVAKMEEAKDVNVVQVLDRAAPPEKKNYPRRLSLVMTSTFIALICAVLLAILTEYWFRLQRNEPEQVSLLKTNLGLKHRQL